MIDAHGNITHKLSIHQTEVSLATECSKLHRYRVTETALYIPTGNQWSSKDRKGGLSNKASLEEQ